MRHFSDRELEGSIGVGEAREVIERAFRDFACGRAAMQGRIRTEAGKTKLSTMGAVLPGEGFAGAKAYTTINGQFTFVILLFAADDGHVLATFDASVLTKLRTAAVSALAAKHLARADSKTLAVFGTGVQALAHVPALADVLPIESVHVVSRGDASAFVASIERMCKLETKQASAEAALAHADVIVTATRSSQPLFDGAAVPPGAFIAAVGATRPEVRELDAATITRCGSIAVEWKEQARLEAGDLIQAKVDWSRVAELGDIVAGKAPGRSSPDEIMLFKSVGVGIEDIAIAGLAYKKLSG